MLDAESISPASSISSPDLPLFYFVHTSTHQHPLTYIQTLFESEAEIKKFTEKATEYLNKELNSSTPFNTTTLSVGETFYNSSKIARVVFKCKCFPGHPEQEAIIGILMNPDGKFASIDEVGPFFMTMQDKSDAERYYKIAIQWHVKKHLDSTKHKFIAAGDYVYKKATQKLFMIHFESNFGSRVAKFGILMDEKSVKTEMEFKW
ncbi:uncharacterized protein LOC141857685 isoform X2 [Brevipalpus obovatus]|uniref:uncharacterized protein LOC141857685 isoform X2 n=1 Tax=Brevipalpus obovatus TaxID=246614 RepID=UPI003D9F917F